MKILCNFLDIFKWFVQLTTLVIYIIFWACWLSRWLRAFRKKRRCLIWAAWPMTWARKPGAQPNNGPFWRQEGCSDSPFLEVFRLRSYLWRLRSVGYVKVIPTLVTESTRITWHVYWKLFGSLKIENSTVPGRGSINKDFRWVHVNLSVSASMRTCAETKVFVSFRWPTVWKTFLEILLESYKVGSLWEFWYGISMLESNVQVELSVLQTIDKVLLLLMIHPQQ